MRRLAPPLVLACLALSACGDFPVLDTAIGPEALSAPYPALLPREALRAAGPAAGPEFAASLEARAAALRVRAAILRRPLRSEADIDAMRAALAR